MTERMGRLLTVLHRKGLGSFLYRIGSACGRYTAKAVGSLLFRKLPIKENYIVFESEGDFCDSARAFYEYLLVHNYHERYRLIWIVKEPKQYCAPPNVRFISRQKHFFSSVCFFYYVLVSKYFIFTHPSWFTYRREGQLVVNIWHGIPIKDGISKDLSAAFDVIFCSSENTRPWFNKFCGAKEEQDIVLGYPRNDLLFQSGHALEKLPGCGGYQKVIICMPTYKQTENWVDSEKVLPFYIQGIESRQQLEEFNDVLAQMNMLFLVKIHHLQDLSFLNEVELSHIRYLKDADLLHCDVQLYHLLGEADALLTDYSSVYLDYLLIDRPVGFLLGDIDTYIAGRGFLFDDYLSYMPGAKLYDYADLVAFVHEVQSGIDQYSADRKRVRDFTNFYQDNNNCQRFAQWLGLQESPEIG